MSLANNPLGAFSYNKVAWDGLTKTKVTSDPVRDPSGRMTKYVKHVIDATGWISVSDADADAFGGHGPALLNRIAEMRRQLREPAKVLQYTGRGYDLTVNAPGGPIFDSANGPIPEQLSFTPIGGNAAVVEFKISTVFPECATARYSEAVAAYSVEISYSIDKHGYTRVTYTGELEIAATLHNGQPVSTADNFREQAEPAKLLGYQRTYDNWDLSADRRTLKFRITDQQLPAPFVTGASEVELRHTVRSTARQGFFTWEASLGGSITIPAGRPRGAAFEIFMVYLTDRLTHTTGLFEARNQARNRWLGRSMVMVTALEIVDDVHGRGGEFRCDYVLFGASLETIVDDAGLWKPPEDADEQTWARDARRDAQHPRGGSKLRHRVSDDVLIDLCSPAKPAVAAGAAPGAPPPPRPTPRLHLDDRFPRRGQRDPEIPPENSWVAWHCSVSKRISNRVAIHTPIGVEPQRLNLMYPVTGADEPVARERRPIQQETITPAGQGHVIQQIGAPLVVVTLSGFAVRVGHEISPPRLLRVGDQEASPGEHYFDQSVDARSGLPIYTAQWEQEYYLPADPRSLPRVANPLLRLDGRA